MCRIAGSPPGRRAELGRRISQEHCLRIELAALSAHGNQQRRSTTRSSTIRPERGRSVTRRRYRLWTRREPVPHKGHRPTLPDARISITSFTLIRTLYNIPTRHHTGAVECLLHGIDSPPIKAPRIPQTASKVCQSQFGRPNDNRPSRSLPHHRFRLLSFVRQGAVLASIIEVN